tara:strand:+ start:78 stop:512 length:435 start_codon:yes stop_codon:yes gene_type:complete
MARKYHSTKKNLSVLPSNNRTVNAEPNFKTVKTNKIVNLNFDDNFYLNGMNYSGIAYRKPNGVYFVIDPKLGDDNPITLIKKRKKKIETISNKREISRQANATEGVNSFQDNKKIDRIKKILNGKKVPKNVKAQANRKLGRRTR